MLENASRTSTKFGFSGCQARLFSTLNFKFKLIWKELRSVKLADIEVKRQKKLRLFLVAKELFKRNQEKSFGQKEYGTTATDEI